MSAGIVPRKASKAIVTEMCIHNMRFLVSGVLAITPKRTKSSPKPAGMSAVGCALPVDKNPITANTVSNTPNTMVNFAMHMLRSLKGG